METTKTTTQQSSSGGSGFLKVLVFLLGAGILGLGYYTYNNYNESEEVKQVLQEQKEQIKNELESMKVNYDQAIQEKGEVSDELIEAKGRVEKMIAEIDKVKRVNSGIIKKYKREIYALKKQRTKLFKLADSLKEANMGLTVEKNKLNDSLVKQVTYNNELLDKNEQLATEVSKARILYPTGIVATGVKVKSSGRIVETQRRRRAQQIRVCFTVPKNDVIPSGPQRFNVVIKNPDGKIIGTNDVIKSEDAELTISGSQDIAYENQALDVCVFVIPKDKDAEIVKGDYAIELYNGMNKVGATKLHLK